MRKPKNIRHMEVVEKIAQEMNIPKETVYNIIIGHLDLLLQIACEQGEIVWRDFFTITVTPSERRYVSNLNGKKREIQSKFQYKVKIKISDRITEQVNTFLSKENRNLNTSHIPVQPVQPMTHTTPSTPSTPSTPTPSMPEHTPAHFNNGNDHTEHVPAQKQNKVFTLDEIVSGKIT